MQDSPIKVKLYGIYSLRTMDVHRGPMGLIEAIQWMKEAEEDCPDADVWGIWGIWEATPTVVKI